jgi:hypothetical protein
MTIWMEKRLRTPLRALFLIAAIVGAPCATAAAAAGADSAAADGLVRVQSRTLDEFYLRPGADLSRYRRVVIDAARVEFERGWLKRMNETRDVTRWLTTDDAQRIAGDAAARMDAAVAAAFTAQGYEIVATPGPGVLHLSPRVVDLYVNAPDVPAPGIQRGFVYEDAGDATLRLEARDADTGALLARVVDRNTAREVGRFDRATSVSNLFWFDAMFRRWMAECAKAFGTARAAP